MHYVAAVRASRPARGTLVSHSSQRIAAARRVAARTVVESHVLARHVAAALAWEDLRIGGGLRENGSSFLSFPYVCPEPVLVKSAFL